MTTPSVPGRFSSSDAAKRLRLWLAVDAVVTGANAIGYLALANVLGDVLGIAPATLVLVGIVLLAFTMLVGWAARRDAAPGPAVSAVVAINAAWVVASFAVVVANPVTLTGVGRLWIALQALVVAAMAGLQGAAARRTSLGGRNGTF